jgi:acetylornithine/N-succinyldiaminopimelate aminotransferase
MGTGTTTPPGVRTTAEIIATEDAWQIPTYTKLPIALVRGQGSYVWDADGRRYLDLYGGHCVAIAGHCHPKLVAALR